MSRRQTILKCSVRSHRLVIGSHGKKCDLVSCFINSRHTKTVLRSTASLFCSHKIRALLSQYSADLHGGSLEGVVLPSGSFGLPLYRYID